MKYTEEVEKQVQRRKRRGRSEIEQIDNVGHHPVFSTFSVTSDSGFTYRVRIQSVSQRRNTCTCPDYRTNLIGTCKHIEGVLFHLQEEKKEKLEEYREDHPEFVRVYLHHAEQITVRISRPDSMDDRLTDLLDGYFDTNEILQGPLLNTLPAFLEEMESLPSSLRERIQVTEPVLDHLDRLRDEEAIEEQKEWYREQVAEGRHSFDFLKKPLYDYQKEGVLHLAFGRRAMLADDMGLGKTVQAIAASMLLRKLRDIHSVLVICPASMKQKWKEEIQKFCSASSRIIDGKPEERPRMYRNPTFFNIINYEKLHRDLEDIQRMAPDVVILDEAQRIKNWRSKTARRVKHLDRPYAFVLTGTPLENRLDEVFSIFQFLEPRLLGPLWKFNERYYEVKEQEDGSYIPVGIKNIDELRERISPYVLRRTRNEVKSTLPERVDHPYYVPLSEPQKRPYRERARTVAELFSRFQNGNGTGEEQEMILKSLQEMRMICTGLAVWNSDVVEDSPLKSAPKLQELRSILQDQVVDSQNQAIVFCRFLEGLALTENILDELNLPYAKLTGEIDPSRRQEEIDRFSDEKQCRVLLSSKVGEQGLDLEAANLVVNLDLPWNPAVLEQRVARAHRPGQEDTVQVMNIMTKNTIEESIFQKMQDKKKIFEGIFEEDDFEGMDFRDMGQVLDIISDSLETPDETKAKMDLEPSRADRVSDAESRSPLQHFTDRIVSRFGGRVLLIRHECDAPGVGQGDHIYVIVDRQPAELRSDLEKIQEEIWSEDPPELHLMEKEGYRSLRTFLSSLEGKQDDRLLYSSGTLEVTEEAETSEERLYREIQEDIESAREKLDLAFVIMDGGFRFEALSPLKESLSLVLRAWIRFARYREGRGSRGVQFPDTEFPSTRTVQSILVEPGYLEEQFATRISHAGDLLEEARQGKEKNVSESVLDTIQETVEDLLRKADRALLREKL